eukprot:jgi/Tetstr1/459148/TSEL_004595.t1
MRGIIKALYGTDDWGAKVLDLLTTSLMASTYSSYEGKIRLFAEFCMDGEGISPLDCTQSTCVRYLALIAERGTTVGAGSLQPYLAEGCKVPSAETSRPSTPSFVTPVGMTLRPPAQPSAT